MNITLLEYKLQSLKWFINIEERRTEECNKILSDIFLIVKWEPVNDSPVLEEIDWVRKTFTIKPDTKLWLCYLDWVRYVWQTEKAIDWVFLRELSNIYTEDWVIKITFEDAPFVSINFN